MGRGHTVDQYLQVTDRIRAVLPDAAVTADAIVGFPGETEEMVRVCARVCVRACVHARACVRAGVRVRF